MMGQNISNMGDVRVTSLRILDDKGDTIGYFGGAYANDGSHLGDAFMSIYNDRGTKVVHVGSGDNSNGGVIKTYNQYGTNITYTGASLNDDGLIVINDKYGDEKWSQ